MNLLRRLERLEAQVHAENLKGEFHVCRTIIYDPRDWEEDAEDEAIARIQSDELDRLVAAGVIRDEDRTQVGWLVIALVTPPTRTEDHLRTA